MPSRRKRTEQVLALALIGAGIGASAWLIGHLRERERLWRWARAASRGLALHPSPLPHEEPEANRHNGHQAL